MKVYKRNPLLKIICTIFILAHAIIGGRMVSTNNTIMGSIVIAASLFWIFGLINEFTPYIKMDENSLQVYSNFITRPREFVFNKELQIYYHTKERLVFTYLNPRGGREKARVQLGYMDPDASVLFVREFRHIIAGFHPEVRKDEAEIAKETVLDEVAATTDTVELTATKNEETKSKRGVSKKAKTGATKKATTSKTTTSKTTKVDTTKKNVKKNKDSEK